MANIKNKTTNNDSLENIKHFMQDTDIRVLVYGPPIVFLGAILIMYLIAVYIPKGTLPEYLFYFGLSILLFIQCFSGIAEIYKKEMPGPMGGVTRGKIAIINGILAIIFPVVFGLPALIYAFMLILK